MPRLNNALCLTLLIFLGTVSCRVPVARCQLSWSTATQIYGATNTAARVIDLKADPSGAYHLVFSVEMAEQIRYMKWTREGWSVPELISSDAFTPFGATLSLDLDDTVPHVLFDSETDDALNLSHRTSMWFTPETIPSTADTIYMDLAIDSAGDPHIIWTRADNPERDVVYSYKSGSTWHHEVIERISAHLIRKYMSIAVDSNFVPRFTWFDDDTQSLKYAIRQGANDFDVYSMEPMDACGWIDMVMLDGNVPLIAYIDIPDVDDERLRYILVIGTSFYDATIATEPAFFGCTMAAADNEGFGIRNLYFVYYSTQTGFRYAYYNMDWITEPMSGMDDYSPHSVLAADWNVEQNRVGLAFTDVNENKIYFKTGRPYTPTPTPGSPSPTPSSPPASTPTPPPCSQLGCTILMPASEFAPGDLCACHLYICNPGAIAMENVPVFALLDVYGSYFFAPAFSSFDHYTEDVPPGMTHITVLPSFNWPEGAGSASGIRWYAAMTDDAITTLIGTLGQFEFGWHE